MRDTSVRAGYCAGVFLLTFVGICTLAAGNVFPAAVDSALVAVVFGLGIGSARRGWI